MKSVRTWVIVADGGHASIYLNEGVNKGLSCLQHELDNELHKNTEINDDKPGRTYESANATRHSFAQTDKHRQEKQLFAQDVIAFVNKKAEQKAFDRLVLVAPPQALGDMRSALNDNTKKLVVGELAKDLTKLSAQDLPKHLGEVIAL